jgi:hypothetical protein
VSDTCINVRFLFWHLQLTTYGKWRFGFNQWRWDCNRVASILKPFEVCEFDLRRRNCESIETKTKDGGE